MFSLLQILMCSIICGLYFMLSSAASFLSMPKLDIIWMTYTNWKRLKLHNRKTLRSLFLGKNWPLCNKRGMKTWKWTCFAMPLPNYSTFWIFKTFFRSANDLSMFMNKKKWEKKKMRGKIRQNAATNWWSSTFDLLPVKDLD